MTVVRGRAGWGAGTVLRALAYLTFGALTLGTGGCGSSNFTFGTNVITVSTTPGNFASYLVYISAVTLTRNDGTVVQPWAFQEQVDLTQLRDITELFGAPAVIEGTYTSATVSVSYTNATLAVDVGGKIEIAKVVDATGATPASITFNVKFDPNHPLVIKHGISSPMDLHFDLAASSVIDTSVSPVKVTVRPFVTANTAPVYTQPIHARGLFVTGNATDSNFVINTRSFFDTSSSPFGALTVQTTPQTTYNVNGVNYTGSAGLAAISALQLNTTVAAVGSITGLASVTPTLTATSVYAGASQDNGLEDHVFGTVSSRTATSINVHGALAFGRLGSGYGIFGADVPVTVGQGTIVTVDGEANVNGLTAEAVSVGQKVNIAGVATVNSSNVVTSFDATSGLIRLGPTAAWGLLNSGATAGAATLDLITLGDYGPSELKFTGTGSTTGADADPTAYVLKTGSIDVSGTPAGTLLRADGIVNAFGSAPPDFLASAVTPGDSTDQVLEVDWVSGGATAPFLSATSSGLVINMSNSHRGTSHVVHTGPTTVDLANPLVNVTVAPAPATSTHLNLYTMGNPATSTALTGFNDFASLLSHINTTLNGTNSLQKLVAVGRYDAATGIFSATRIDIVQQQ